MLLQGLYLDGEKVEPQTGDIFGIREPETEEAVIYWCRPENPQKKFAFNRFESNYINLPYLTPQVFQELIGLYLGVFGLTTEKRKTADNRFVLEAIPEGKLIVMPQRK